MIHPNMYGIAYVEYTCNPSIGPDGSPRQELYQSHAQAFEAATDLATDRVTELNEDKNGSFGPYTVKLDTFKSRVQMATVVDGSGAAVESWYVIEFVVQPVDPKA